MVALVYSRSVFPSCNGRLVLVKWCTSASQVRVYVVIQSHWYENIKSTVLYFSLSNSIIIQQAKDKGNHAPWRVWISDEKLVVFASLISPSKSVCLRSYIKHSPQCFITISKTSKFVKNSPLRVVFPTLYSVFDMWRNSVLCLICYF